MKYYSEITKKIYDSDIECQKEEARVKGEQIAAEKREAEKKQARAADAKIVEDAHKTMVEAQDAYEKAVADFVKKYGSYHFTANSVEDFPRFIMNFLGM